MAAATSEDPLRHPAQLRAEVALWERALDRCARICADLVRLNIEDKLLRVTTHQTERLAELLDFTLRGTCQRLDLTDQHIRDTSAEEMALVPGVS